MVNITRPATPPAALAQAPVQAFVAASAAYKANPTTAPKPKRPTGYRNSDLLAVFDAHFHCKCYLTEQRFETSWAMDVDHFEPVSHNPGRVLDWTNLYPIAPKANTMRGNHWPAGGLLDPCADTDDVERDIIYTLVEQGEKPGFHAADPANVRAVNTARLLDELHNGKPDSADSASSAGELRYLIVKKYKQVLEALVRFHHAHRGTDQQAIWEASDALSALLSRKRSFTMLMRSLPFIRNTVPPELLD